MARYFESLNVTNNLFINNNQITNGPLFSASCLTGTSISNTGTKLLFQNVLYDTNGCYSTGTSRFTPNVPGYYQVGGNTLVSGTANSLTTSVYKNGTEFRRGFRTNTSSVPTSNVFCSVFMNGTTDFVELWATATGTSVNQLAGISSYFEGFLERGP